MNVRERAQVALSRKRVMMRAQALDQEARDLANDALARSKAHEELCSERWTHQSDTMARVEKIIGEIKTAVDDRIGKLPAGIIAGLTGLVGYLSARAFPIH